MPSLADVLARETREGELYDTLPDGRLRCYACGHCCPLPEGAVGVCKVRFNEGGRLKVPWGYVGGVQCDPIEKKPFFHAYPGALAYSFGMLGCDLHCGYCQNWVTSQALRDPAASVEERLVIGRQVAHLSRLIDDLLDVSRITQGKIQLRWDAVDMKSVVANAVELTKPLFEKHTQPVELRLAQGPAVVVGDAVRLTQVLCNLLVNAAKFTPPDGRITLALERVDRFIEASVQDNGSGIEAQPED